MADSDFTWNDVLSPERYVREADPSEYKKINYTEDSEYNHCSHVLIFAKTNMKSFDLYDRKAIVLMQMRFDGLLGFPGGEVDEGETPLQAANREIKEEIGWSEKEGPVMEKHYQFSHLHQKSKLILHFYAVEVDEEKITSIECGGLKAKDHGEEALGMIRIPLYTMGDAYRGFPAFLHNQFAGNAKYQLVDTLINLQIVTREYVIQALNSKPRMIT